MCNLCMILGYSDSIVYFYIYVTLYQPSNSIGKVEVEMLSSGV